MGYAVTARIAGLAFLVYIAAGLASLALTHMAGVGEGEIGERLASMAANATLLRYAALLDLLCALCALLLGAALFAITSAHGAAAAAFAMSCRFIEAALIAASLSETLDVLDLAVETPAAGEPALSVASYALQSEVLLTSVFFAVGSLVFAVLFVRARSIPRSLAWLGVFASLLLVIVLPLQLVGLLDDPRLAWAWAPMLAFEAPLGLWLLIMGVKSPDQRRRS